MTTQAYIGNAWIPEETCKLYDMRLVLRHDPVRFLDELDPGSRLYYRLTTRDALEVQVSISSAYPNMTRHWYIRGIIGLSSGTKTPETDILMPTRFAINRVTTESTNI